MYRATFRNLLADLALELAQAARDADQPIPPAEHIEHVAVGTINATDWTAYIHLSPRVAHAVIHEAQRLASSRGEIAATTQARAASAYQIRNELAAQPPRPTAILTGTMKEIFG